MKQDYTPLDQDTLTRLVYTHDDEITELTQKMLLLIDRIEQVEESKSSQKVVNSDFWQRKNRTI